LYAHDEIEDMLGFKEEALAIESKRITRPSPLTDVKAGKEQIPRVAPEDVTDRGLKVDDEQD